MFDIGFFPALRETAQIVHGEFVVYGDPQQLLQAGFDFAGRGIAGQEVRRIAPGDPPGQLGSVLRPELFDRPAEFSDMDRRGETVIFGELRDGPRERPRIGGRDAPAGLAPERLRRVGPERIQFRRIAEVREDRAGFHRRELVFVAEQDETALRPQRIEQFPHQQQRDHRALVDDDQVPRQRVPAVVPAVAARIDAEQPVQGRTRQRKQPRFDRIGDVQPADAACERLRKTRLRLAGRRGERHGELRIAFEFKREQRRHHGGLAGSGTARYDRERV